MSKIIEGNTLMHCNVYSHEAQILDQVCVEETCVNRGLQCERCIRQTNNNTHNNHLVLSLSRFIEQYKQGISNHIGELSTDQKQLQTLQNDIMMYLQNLLKTLQQHVQSAMDRLNIQFENDIAAFNTLIQVEQKYNMILTDLEKKDYTSADDAKKKVNELLEKVTFDQKKKLMSVNINNKVSQQAKQSLSLGLSAKNNVAQETQNIAKDVQAYLDGLFRYVSGVKGDKYSNQMGGSKINSSENQVGRNNNSNINFTNSLQLQQSSFNHGPTFGANSIGSSIINPNIQEDHNQALKKIALGVSSINQRTNDQFFLKLSQERKNNNNNNNNNPLLESHEFKRNNENLNSKVLLPPAISNNFRITTNTSASSPAKEEIKIFSAASRVNTNNPVAQSYFLGNTNNNNINIVSNDNSSFQDVNDSSFIPQEGKVERSYSLTNNISKANSRSMSSQHLQYFQVPQKQQLMGNNINNYNTQLYSRNIAIGPTMAISNGINNNTLSNMSQMNYPNNSSSLLNGKIIKSNNNVLLRNGSINHILGQSTIRMNGNRVWWQAHDGPVRDIVFIDGDNIASGGDDGLIKIWEKIEGRLLISLLGHSRAIICLSYHSGAHTLVSGSEDKTIKVWRPVPTWQCVRTLNGNGDTISALRFLNETMIVSGCLDGKICVYNLEQGEICKLMDRGDNSKITCLLILGNNRLLAGQNTLICVWDSLSGSIFKTQEAHSDQIVSLLLVKGRRSDQQLVISCSKDSKVKLWEASTLILLKSFVEIFPIADIVYVSEIDALAVSLIPAKQYQAQISLWSLSTLKKIFQLAENNSVANKLLYDHTLKLFYSAHDDQVIQYTKIAQ